MAEWIKMRTDLLDDPAVFRLSNMLHLDRFNVVGMLHTFWSWNDHHAVDGRVDGAASQVVDVVVSCPGFADALTVVGWLGFDDRGLYIPNWERHNGQSAKQRALKNQRQEKWRTTRRMGGAKVDAKPSTSASTREDKNRTTPIVPGGFAAFVEKYPRSRINSKRKALAIWQRDKLEPIAATIVAHVERMASTPDWKREGGKFVPNVTTYLNDARWETGPPAAADQPRELAI